jgi:tetratricopeptide (TPR) repeat protein
MNLYSSREVASLLGLQESRVRYWAQTGFVGPSVREGGRMMYNFQDLVGVKAAKELLDRGVSLQRARKNLDALRTQLPQVTQPLATLRIVSDGEKLLFVGSEPPFEPLTGQVVMDFAVGALEAEVHKLQQPTPRKQPSETAWAWFLEGVQLDGRDDDRALIAYQKALDGDPQLAAAHTNLGALLYRRNDLTEARRHFDEALRLDPEQPEARYNFANLCDELGDRERALSEWLRVVSACPEFADAHFNLAQALAEEGAHAPAKRHLERYLALDGDGDWATRARDLLKQL